MRHMARHLSENSKLANQISRSVTDWLHSAAFIDEKFSGTNSYFQNG